MATAMRRSHVASCVLQVVVRDDDVDVVNIMSGLTVFVGNLAPSVTRAMITVVTISSIVTWLDD